MSRSDYAHWNEEQDMVWWEEEGKHELNPDRYEENYEQNYDDSWVEATDEEIERSFDAYR